jgi:protein phosphatase
MSDDKKALPVHSSALSDRGLNERRPLNEDSYLADGERRIFAVADGVGGAEAGEVASQTAIEVLDEAFRHHDDGADIEDLMELAIQRANSSIHQMAQEHQKFSMMATTIVALHLNGKTATIGHVGDSRLYRLTPEGQLIRETEDHSIVEEEVRAGRMTPEQAANHPSKNVISRALGAEEGVEVDMKTLEVEEGTEFLLCTDGITRHISDSELRQLLVLNDDLETICSELKQRCYERGAEDNLTVVIVRVGERISVDQRLGDMEPTITPEMNVVPVLNKEAQQTVVNAPGAFVPASRIAFPAPAEGAQPVVTNRQTLNVADPKASRSGGGGKVLLFLFVLALLAAAFYAGARYKEKVPFLASAKPVEQSVAPVVPAEEPFVKFERSRREVDRDPHAWLENEKARNSQGGTTPDPLASNDSELLYLYGRANLLSGNTDLATKAFELAIEKVDANPSPAGDTIRKEATLGLAAVSLKTLKERENALKHFDELTKPTSNTNSR